MGVNASSDDEEFDRSLEPTAVELKVLSNVRNIFLASASILADYPWPPGAGNELRTFLMQTNDRAQIDEQAWRYCQSVTIHFLMGHEFGHYCYRFGRDPYIESLRSFARQLVVSLAKADDGLVEEVFCDTIAMENCLFQLEYFGVPPNFTIFSSLWLLELISQSLLRGKAICEDQTAVLRQLEIRKQALASYWRRRVGLDRHPCLASIAEKASAALDGVGPVVARDRKSVV